MKHYLLLAALAVTAGPALAGDVNVAVSVGEPGFYGQIVIGNAPPPPVIYARPIVVRQAPEYVAAPPIYLHVPPGHEKHWRKHCAEYNACGRPVYFVHHDWYEHEYVRRYQRGEYGRREERHEEHEHDRGRHQGRDHEERDRDRDR